MTLRDVVNVKSACVCIDKRRVIGTQDLRKRDEDLESIEVSTIRVIYRIEDVFCDGLNQEERI